MRYERNFNTLSKKEQETLGQSTVAVAGLGGLGGGVCEMLARTGVGRLIVMDGDVFEDHNLNRQLLSREDLIGQSKASAAKERIALVNSEVRVLSYDEFLDESNMADRIRGADVVMDCLDSIDTRFKLQDAANKESVPIVSGAIAGVTGQVTVICPGDPGYELIYGSRAEGLDKGVELKTGNISYCAMMIASIQASECIKILLEKDNILRNRLLITDLWSNTFEVVRLS